MQDLQGDPKEILSPNVNTLITMSRLFVADQPHLEMIWMLISAVNQFVIWAKDFWHLSNAGLQVF